ncbi:MAG: ammonia-forming cytochrome c nitrite reductase subunit c552, partial [Ignavibacteriae bacterium]|nr:ammonia-forming cytochrome c nitrite reductase subunit c552 [Ignavibacteriota bacterium]
QALNPNLTTADFQTIGCATCHDPHGTPNEFNLRTRIAGSDTLSGGYTYPMAGTGKVCLDCHKARRNPVWYVQSKITSSTWGPHHSTQGDVLLGKNAASFGGVPYITGSHKNISGMCVGCHMAPTTDTGTVTRDKVGGHTWNLHYAATNYDHVAGCTGCHPGKTSFDDFLAPEDYDGDNTIEPWQKEVEGCISKLGHALPHIGYDSVMWNLIAADSNNVNLRKAFWNYQYIKYDGSLGMHNPFYTIQVLLTSVQYAVGVQNISNEIPIKYELSQNYPNPFNPNTKINFSITKSENVTLKVYDIMGREVISLVNQKMNPGKYSTEWTGINGEGVKVASGVYFYRMVTPSYVEVKRMVLVK